jgi:hypothetical protein
MPIGMQQQIGRVKQDDHVKSRAAQLLPCRDTSAWPGMPIEDIAHLVAHANTRVTELVYRKELRPVLTRGAAAMDAVFPDDTGSRSQA